MPTIEDLINTALGQQPTKFASVFDDIMGQKTTAAIEDMHASIAQGIYSTEDESDPDDQDITDDDAADDIDDDEFDDVDDLDLDDTDFDDSDLEGLNDGEDA